MKKNQKKTYALLTTALLAIVGSYNALMIHSDSKLSLSESANIKRIDEIYGSVKVGRKLAVATDWRKISKSEVAAQVAKILQHPEVVIWPKLGHLAHEEDPELCAQLILAILHRVHDVVSVG